MSVPEGRVHGWIQRDTEQSRLELFTMTEDDRSQSWRMVDLSRKIWLPTVVLKDENFKFFISKKENSVILFLYNFAGSCRTFLLGTNLESHAVGQAFISMIWWCSFIGCSICFHIENYKHILCNHFYNPNYFLVAIYLHLIHCFFIYIHIYMCVYIYIYIYILIHMVMLSTDSWTQKLEETWTFACMTLIYFA